MADRDVPAPLLQNLIETDRDHPPPDGPSCAPPRVAIVGGSMGGCCAAIALAAEGCPVTVFERTPGELPSRGAGLVIQPDMQAFLRHFEVVKDISTVSFMSSGRQYVDRSGAVLSGDDTPQAFSAWDVLHRALRAAVPRARITETPARAQARWMTRRRQATPRPHVRFADASNPLESWGTGQMHSCEEVECAALRRARLRAQSLRTRPDAIFAFGCSRPDVQSAMRSTMVWRAPRRAVKYAALSHLPQRKPDGSPSRRLRSCSRRSGSWQMTRHAWRRRYFASRVARHTIPTHFLLP